MPPVREVSVYFHVPFCQSRCGYCAFLSGTALSLREPYREALCRAVRSAPLADCRIKTVYFGGGTPTLLGEGLLSVLTALRERAPLLPGAEITVEANPGTVTLPLLQKLREGGFNRISFGLQDRDDAMLRLLGRGHTAREGEEALRMAREAGFANISADFMLATPHQTPEKARALAEYAVSLGVPHLSSYLLNIEPGTPFGRRNMGALCPGEDEAADCYLAYYETLEQAGFSHYEISNAARPGFESRHNTAYWKLSEYLGIGPSAASFFGGRRFRFGDSAEKFIKAADPWRLPLDEGAGGDWEEAGMLALRLKSGLTRPLTARFGVDFEGILKRAEPLQKAGLLQAEGDAVSLTDRGFLVGNAVTLALLEGTI